MSKRLRAYHHNSLRGRVQLTISTMFSIIQSDSASKEAKQKAEEILPLLGELNSAMKTRVDP